MAPFNPLRCYRIVAVHSGSCIQRTVQNGLIHGTEPTRENLDQLWRLRSIDEQRVIVSACHSDWVITHHGMVGGPISLSPCEPTPSEWQVWTVASGLNDSYFLLTGHQLEFNGVGAPTCLAIPDRLRRSSNLVEWHVDPPEHDSHQRFQVHEDPHN